MKPIDFSNLSYKESLIVTSDSLIAKFITEKAEYFINEKLSDSDVIIDYDLIDELTDETALFDMIIYGILTLYPPLPVFDQSTGLFKPAITQEDRFCSLEIRDLFYLHVYDRTCKSTEIYSKIYENILSGKDSIIKQGVVRTL